MNKLLIWKSFERIADCFPGKKAIFHHERSISYENLRDSVIEFADHLVSIGVKKNDIVGTYLDGSIDFILIILGIMKIGGIFMPLNIHFPDFRLLTLLERVRPAAIVVNRFKEKELLARISKESIEVEQMTSFHCAGDEKIDLKTFLINVKNPMITGGEKIDYSSHPLSDDACYIITTSSSTGEPKVILGSEKGLLHFLNWAQKEFEIDEHTCISLLAPVTFDVSLRDIFLPLLSGGSLAIPNNELKSDPDYLLAWMEEKAISHMHIVPTLFRLLTRTLIKSREKTSQLRALKRILLAGEPLYGDDVLQWKNCMGGRINLVNLYGPTETTLAKCYYRIGPNDKFAPREIIPLGQPIPDTEIIIAAEGRICPPEEVGEIYIKTEFRSLGYYKETDLNRRAFIKDPAIIPDGSVLYKTGDLGWMGKDGLLRFYGRKDNQIKLYGNRMDLGEIEVILRRHPAVLQAAAKVANNHFGEQRLIGYIVTDNKKAASVESLNSFLRNYLPIQMVPAAYVFLSSLPLTHNGKVDRGALPEPSGSRPELEQHFVAPGTEMEKRVTGIWSYALGLDRIGVLDNFFDLGGTSVLAARTLALINEELESDIPLVKLFQYPNIRQLARYIEDHKDVTPVMAKIIERARQYEKARLQKRVSMMERYNEKR